MTDTIDKTYSELFGRLDFHAPFSSGTSSAGQPKGKVIDYVTGIPDFDLLPRRIFAEAFAGVMDSIDAFSSLRYSPYPGVEQLRVAIARQRHTRPENVLITDGATQGIFLAASAVLNPGDHILVENPTFPFAIKTFRALGLHVDVVPVGAGGIDVQALEDKLRSGIRYKALYTIPDFQNPTGVSQDVVTKEALTGLADRYGFVIIADSPYRDLWFNNSPAEFPQEQRTAHDSGHLIEIGSFSKVLGPGWRTGWIITDERRLASLSVFRRSVDAHPSGVSQYVIAHLMQREDGWYETFLNHSRQVYGARADILHAALAEAFGERIRQRKPQGGYFLWAEFDESMNPASPRNAQALADASIRLVPGGAFYPLWDASSAARLAFCHAPIADLREGAARLAEVLFG